MIIDLGWEMFKFVSDNKHWMKFYTYKDNILTIIMDSGSSIFRYSIYKIDLFNDIGFLNTYLSDSFEALSFSFETEKEYKN